MNDTVEKRQTLAMSLRRAGCSVDVETRLDWHREGQFERANVTPDTGLNRRRVWAAVLVALFLGLGGLLTSRFIRGPKAVSSGQVQELPARSATEISTATVTQQTQVIVSGRVTRKRPPHVGIMVGIVPPGAIVPTDDDGNYRVTIRRAEGSYTGVAFDPITKETFIGYAQVLAGQETLSFGHDGSGKKR